MKQRCGSVLVPVLALFLSSGLAASDPARPIEASGADDTTYERWIVRVYYEDLEDIRPLNEYDLLEYNNREQQYVLVAIDSAEHAALLERGYRV